VKFKCDVICAQIHKINSVESIIELVVSGAGSGAVCRSTDSWQLHGQWAALHH